MGARAPAGGAFPLLLLLPFADQEAVIDNCYGRRETMWVGWEEGSTAAATWEVKEGLLTNECQTHTGEQFEAEQAG